MPSKVSSLMDVYLLVPGFLLGLREYRHPAQRVAVFSTALHYTKNLLGNAKNLVYFVQRAQIVGVPPVVHFIDAVPVPSGL